MTEEEKSFEVDTPIAKVRTKGYRMHDLLGGLGVAMVTLLVAMGIEARSETKVTAAQIAAASKVEHDRLYGVIERFAVAQEEANYIQTLAQREREHLNLRMPESLRRKIAPMVP